MKSFVDFEDSESSSDDFVSVFNDPNHQIMFKDWYCSPDLAQDHSYNQLFESSI
jgi:hypothetical protein